MLSQPVPRGLARLQRASRAFVLSTVRPLQRHHYSLFDLQYLFLAALLLFCYLIIDKPTWFKLPIALVALVLLVPRRTRLFMLPFGAVAAWLLLFYSCRFIPSNWRPHIFTSVLPALENILYGGNISELLAQQTSPAKDVLAWIPYGVLHYVLPIVTAILIVIFAPAGTLPVFARTFGYMNIAGVLTQIFFPCAPPWYETRYGDMQPAAYSMPGDPGGLARVDDILGISMYKTTFTASPLVFGAFPSLHSADACLLAFFVVYIFGPRSIPFALSYVFWIWWATMYLGHHYVVDLVGGGAYAVIAFWLGSYFLPPVLPPMDDEEYDQDDGYDIAAGSTLNKFALDRNHQALHPQEKQVLFQAPADYDDDQDNEHNGKDRNYKDYKDRMTNDIRISEMKRPMEEPLWPQDGEEEFSTPTTATSTGDLSDMGGKMRFQNGYTAVDMMELKSLVVQLPMLAELEIEEEAGAGAGARQSRSEPASPTGSHHSSSSAASSSSSTTASSWTRKSKRVVTSIQTSSRTARTSGGVRQSWNGWQGYESWIEVLARVHSPKTSPRNSPKTSPSPSPRSSTGQSPVSMV